MNEDEERGGIVELGVVDLKMYRSVVYRGDDLLGEVEIYPQNQNQNNQKQEIRISHMSQPSERCPPLAVLHTITSCGGLCFKMESSKSQSQDSPLFLLHSSCLRENKENTELSSNLWIWLQDLLLNLAVGGACWDLR